MFAEIEKEYYASIDLVFLFYHGMPESVEEVQAKVQKITEIRPQAFICLLRNGEIGRAEALLNRSNIIHYEFDPTNPVRSREILKIAVNRYLHLNQNAYENAGYFPNQSKPCALF
jgi:hypothetical protein